MASELAAPSRTGWAGPLEAPISWSAIIAGSVVALAIATLLTFLASGFGLTLIHAGVGSRRVLLAFTPTAGAIAVAIQVLSAGFGGFVAGRLRLQWAGAHTDESHFRDTAHGLLVWALSAMVGFVLAATVFVPYADTLVAQTVPAALPSPADALRMSNIAAQAAFFTGVGMLLSAFTAAVTARLGGIESEHMHAKRPPAHPL